jgi:hypothetical protein
LIGGHCVDNPAHDVGPSLEANVSSLVAIAGPNYGGLLCPAASPLTPPCSPVTGVVCHSQYLDDINGYNGGSVTGGREGGVAK